MGLKFLMAVVFGTGWVMMGLEIIGGRMLQPAFGSEVYVWGSIIGVFLLSLSIGYFLGGRLSVRIVSPRVLAGLIAASGVLILIIPFVRHPVVDFILDYVHDGEWGALLSATVLFLVPTTLLGMVSPYAIRLSADEVATVGDRAGQLYAISTLGSFLGTLYTAFYGFLHFEINQLYWAEGGALLAIGLIVAIVSWREGVAA